MFINLHRYVLDRLAARDMPWTQVARDTGMSYETLKKIASGRTPNPGVQHVQTLADYFLARGAVAVAAPQTLPCKQTALDAPAVNQPQPSFEVVIDQHPSGPERRHTNTPQNPDLERCAPLAAALAGNTGV